MTPIQSCFQCPNPVALVTGSSAARVGRVIAKRLAGEGCRIAIHGRRSDDRSEEARQQIERTYGVPTLGVFGDVAEEGCAARLVTDVHDAWGRLDVVVNSAAIWKPTPLGEVTREELRHYFDINTIACFEMAVESAKIMVDQPRGGAIVNIGDWATARPYLDHAAYFPSKGAVEVMTRSLAVELSRQNRCIRVNCVQPGPVLLDEKVDDATRKALAESTLVGRIGTPESIADAVAFLCGNDFVTGVCLPVDGGRSIYSPDGLQWGKNTG